MSKINRHPVRRTAAGVLAGALALSGAVATAVPASAAATFDLQRIAGEGRYETSAAIARAFIAANTGAVTNVIVASGESTNTPDALAASFLAGVRNAPVVLTQRNTTPGATRDVLNTLRTQGATTLTVVGGPAAVSDEQVTALRALGFTVERIGGANRYETAANIATAGEGTTASNVGLLASGTSTIDALAGGPVAFKGRHPLFLTTRDGVPGATIRSMQANGVTSVYILGGTAVVSERVVTQLRNAGITVVARLAGADRSATSVAIARAVIGGTFGFTNTTFNVASGINGGVDALGGAALSGKQNRVLLVTNTATSAAPIEAFARENVANLTAVGNVFGGATVVSDALVSRIETAAGASAGPIALTAATVAQGGNITGTITGDFSSVTVSGCGFTNQAIGADDNATTAGRQFTLSVGAQAVGNCTLTFTATPTGGGAAVTQTVQVAVTAGNVGATATVRPELISAAVVSTTTEAAASTTNPEGTVIRYTFDEAVTGGGFTQASFLAYTSGGAPIAAGQAAVLDPNDNRSVLVRYQAINTAALATQLAVATVRPLAVTDNQSLTNPEGDAPLGANRTITQGTAGTTTQPDLVSVGNFRASTTTGRTAVDFTFDQNAFPVSGAGFSLVATDGTLISCTGPTATDTTAGTNAVGGAGTTVLTVTCANPAPTTTSITAATIARGVVAADSVARTAVIAAAVGGAPGTGNPLQATQTPDASSTSPDLVSVSFASGAAGTSNPDVATFTFDAPVALTGGTAANGEFRVYGQDGTETPALGANVARSQGNAAQIIVQFANGDLDGRVGASVVANAVQDFSATPVSNQADEVGVTNPSTTTVTAGRTAGPDLTAVTLSVAATDPVTGANNYTATYVFDEAIASETDNRFNLYLADGTQLEGSNCTISGTDTTRVDCTTFTAVVAATAATEAQIGAAVAGTVEATAVTSTTAAGAQTNPEGYEVTTGGTGTARQS